jgi:hypothetical protein
VVTGAAVRGTRTGQAYTRLLVATARPQQSGELARQIEDLHHGSVQVLRGPRLLSVRVPRSEAAALSRRLERMHGVRFVQRDRVAGRIASTGIPQAIPTDPLWAQEWGPALIGAPAAWKVTMGSPRVVIAVLDSGVDFSQPDLRQALVPGYDFVNQDDDPSDDNGHGTRTAGIAGARADNGVGISGVCPRCSIMPVKVVDPDGHATDFNLASGITWAVDHGASIISMSLGGARDDVVAAAVSYAESKGVIVVAAAGNNGNSEPFYPAADPGVLSVAGTNQDDQLYSWSNFGRWVSVAAPGCDVTTFDGGGFGGFCGTSASTPFVAGLAGLARSYSPNSSPETIEHAIIASAHPVDGIAGGRVDAVGTLTALGAKFQPVSAAKRTSSAKPAVHRTATHPRRRLLAARVRRGVLRMEWHLRLKVHRGRFIASLSSPKARSCSVALRSGRHVRRSARLNRDSNSLVARVSRGTYGLDVRCNLRRPLPALLTIRAHFPMHHRGPHWRRRVLEVRGPTVAVESRRDPF